MLPIAFLEYFYLPPEYLIATLIGVAISGFFSMRVKSTFKRYSKVALRSGMSGAEAAAAVCRAGGANDVTIERVGGFLSDHYDPRGKVLRLSEAVYDGHSISSVAVAAHEAGHSIQDVESYAPLGLRSLVVPVASIGSRFWPMLVIMGGIFQSGGLQMAGIVLFAGVVFFQLVTLPVEFDASRRAKLVLASTGITSGPEEDAGVEKVLNAAAMTYVAAAVTAVLQLVALIMSRRD